MSEMQEALKEFVIESHENLDQLDTDLVGLEKSAAPTEALGRIFRTLHTIKGSCSFLGFPHLETTAHAGENLLGKLRDGKTELTPEVTAALLRVVDAIRKMLASIEHEGHDGQSEDRVLIDELNRLASGTKSDRSTVAAAAPKSIIPDVSFVAGKPPSAIMSAVREAAQERDGNAPSPPETSTADASAVYDASVRIHVDLLNKLMRVAGEIVLARNQILQYGQKYEDPAFQNTCRQLNLITTELQEYVMKTRLQPIGNVWNRFPRLVHDTAHACGKKVRLETEGSETELDKTLIEAIRDPLTHLVRNAIDHGIESPARRLELGKPEEGCVRLRAYHEGGQVIVECSDDGRGIEPERVKFKAIEKNLITAEQAAGMGPQTILGLIFLPGFSTAQTVTTLSGRGVGMDVVKTNIEKIGGAVDIHSPVGQGTTVRVRIPLTLAIIKVLVVKSGRERYAIPQVSLLELVRLEGEQAHRGIELIHDAPVYRLRGNLLPLVYLRQQLQLNAAASGERGMATENGNGVVNIVVLQADNRQFGLVVDSIGDTEEIVVKPLQKQLKGINVFAGATIMGDGKVALILDVLGLAQRARVVRGAHKKTLSEKEAVTGEPSAPLETVLLFNADDRGRMAIPLAMVDRLEVFPRSAIERVGPLDVVQYRERILPLIDVSRLLNGSHRSDRDSGNPQSARCGESTATADGRDRLQVIVVASQGRRAGLVVERIVDIAEEAIVGRSEAHRPLALFTAVIQGRVTEVLDVERIVRQIDPARDGATLTVAAGT
jgi:two-component system, chemotaxis family, sensor kinase CheA